MKAKPFAEIERYFQDNWLCPGCGEIHVVRRGALCWRCRAWEEERGRAARGLFWGAVLGTILWAALWAALRLVVGGHHAP